MYLLRSFLLQLRLCVVMLANILSITPHAMLSWGSSTEGLLVSAARHPQAKQCKMLTY